MSFTNLTIQHHGVYMYTFFFFFFFRGFAQLASWVSGVHVHALTQPQHRRVDRETRTLCEENLSDRDGVLYFNNFF